MTKNNLLNPDIFERQSEVLSSNSPIFFFFFRTIWLQDISSLAIGDGWSHFSGEERDKQTMFHDWKQRGSLGYI